MSYQVLARKWRPQQFSELVGQDHVKSALIHALSNNRLHHAYLFTGTRGVGKTTIARIFAKSLNCETGVTATPCGRCSACQEIDQGFFVDLLEIDAASRTKVEDTRDLLDNVQYAPTRGRYKVYLIDEVHMLSRHSFNALLKTLEEPPPHVKFLLATTDPQKLPITVLSRCLQFSLKALNQSQIKQHLQHVLAEEHIPAEEDALALLARAAKGSLRDSLSLTDQAIAQTNGDIRLTAVREMLGYLEQSWAELLLQDVLNRDVAAMQQHLSQLCQAHSHYGHVLDDMLSLLHLAALSQFQLSASEMALTESAFVRTVAKQIPAETIQLYYQLLLSGKKELPYAPEQRVGLEMTLLRAIAFVPAPATASDSPVQHARAAALSAAGIPSASNEPQVSAPSEPSSSLVPQGEAFVSAPSTQVAAAASSADAVSPVTVAPVTIESVNEGTPQAVQESEQAAAEERIDPVTARILARRGVAVGGTSEPAKKFDAAPAAFSRPALPTSQSLSASMKDVEAAPAMDSLRSPSPHAPTLVAAASTLVQSPKPSEQDLPPWEDPPVTGFNTPLPSNHLEQGEETASVPEGTTESSSSNEQAEAAPYAKNTRAESDGAPKSSVADSTVSLADDADDEEDIPADPMLSAAMPEWQWQPQEVQPIRHALLDSLSLEQPDVDFASEEVETIEAVSELSAPLEFHREINASNFALRTSAQIDEWAARIDSLRIGGLMRLFLLHSAAELTANHLQLRVAQSQRHLDSERNREQLRLVLSESFELADLELTVLFAEEVPESPQALQERIQQARRRYVEQVLQQDPDLSRLCQTFDAVWVEGSLEVF